MGQEKAGRIKTGGSSYMVLAVMLRILGLNLKALNDEEFQAKEQPKLCAKLEGA